MIAFAKSLCMIMPVEIGAQFYENYRRVARAGELGELGQGSPAGGEK